MAPVLAQSGLADPEFAKVPFAKWLEGTGQAQIKWSVRLRPPALSRFQRLATRVEVRVDGAELLRRSKGSAVFLVQLTDDAGGVWQDHGTIEPQKVEDALGSSEVIYTESIFVVPGDYQVAVAVLFTETGEHAVRKEKLHVAPLKNDPLPQSWRDMPRVEFRPSVDPPDNWYEPAAGGRLYLPVKPREPVRIRVLVNLTPSEESAGPMRSQDANLGALFPALKAIAQIDAGEAPFDIALLDLSRRRVVFEQEHAHSLDWTAVKTALKQADPGTIDVKALADRRQNAAFFVSEVARRIDPAQTSQPARVLIVLSGSMSFEHGQDLRSIRITPPPDCRVYYFRFAHWLPRTVYPRSRVRGRREVPDLPPLTEMHRSGELDQLAPTLKPLGPRVFDVDRPEQFRKALATMLAEIGRVGQAF
jgi:hypothetical protein